MQTNTSYTFDKPITVSKVRETTMAERTGYLIMREHKTLSRQELINKIKCQGHKHGESEQAVIYLINSHDIVKHGDLLEFREWKL
ncbi:hypothetical protein [Acinetobacter phage HFM1]|nr:hypothetical protein [Acinetobacter phage HFM1]